MLFSRVYLLGLHFYKLHFYHEILDTYKYKCCTTYQHYLEVFFLLVFKTIFFVLDLFLAKEAKYYR
jgi:hypothetical protein